MIEKVSFPSDKLEITAWTEDGLIMAARHKIYKHLQVRSLLPGLPKHVPRTHLMHETFTHWEKDASCMHVERHSFDPTPTNGPSNSAGLICACLNFKN